MDAKTLGLMGGVLVLLITATIVVHALRRRTASDLSPALLDSARSRLRAWWLLFAGLVGAVLLPYNWPTVVLFGLISFWALREFITLTPTRMSDHRTLFWVFFLCTPLQFILVGVDSDWLQRWLGVPSYGLYSIVIPVYAMLLIPFTIALSGDHKRFLERTAKIQAGLLVCVYCLSYAPALLNLDLPGPDAAGNKRLLFFFVLITQLSDALQYAWSQLPSKHVIVPAISPNRTWEGLLGGASTSALLGAILWWATPFPSIWVAVGVSVVVALMGFAGGLSMSAIKRDRGVDDYGTLVEGHSGVLDRIDSLCFAAPVFFHLTQYCLRSAPSGG